MNFQNNQSKREKTKNVILLAKHIQKKILLSFDMEHLEILNKALVRDKLI